MCHGEVLANVKFSFCWIYLELLGYKSGHALFSMIKVML